MKRMITIGITIVFLVVSISIMISGQWLKNSFHENDQLFETVQSIESDIKKENWVQAENDIDYVTTAWRLVVNRIQFSVERELINEITTTIYYMKGGIQARDRSVVQQNIAYFYILWEGVGK
ncbi:hypothetical protein [Bacillus solimangrovi]|uniref:DUF4363 domain-containing protein n=1 Tax=Bacillus solimangrovi TaxID=1305675 RepID=A0A1E5LIW6_9BACI|nr:hypothetical protein [Bacillus solimangrovi]OEH94027.1 hypothetical protein BFG57_10300 [Bacillus solimangrovi]